MRIATMLAGLAVLIAACGGGTDEPAGLPVDDNPADTPAAAGTCLAGEPDCADTGGDMAAQPLPGGDDDAVTSSGMPAGGGLSVSEALASDVSGTIALQGFLIDDGTGPRLCEALAESFPPQCGGASLPVSGHEEMIDVPLVDEQGVTWTDTTVTLYGEIVDGAFVVDPTVTG